MATITGADIQLMVRHWLHTPTYGYLGSDYGCDPKALLQNPQSIGVANAFIAKLKKEGAAAGDDLCHCQHLALAS